MPKKNASFSAAKPLWSITCWFSLILPFFHSMCMCVYVSTDWMRSSFWIPAWLIHPWKTDDTEHESLVTVRLWAQPYSQRSPFKAVSTSLMVSAEEPETVTLGEWNAKPPWPQLRSSKNRFPLYSSEQHLASLGQTGRTAACSVSTTPHFSGAEAVTEECSLCACTGRRSLIRAGAFDQMMRLVSVIRQKRGIFFVCRTPG